MAVVNRWTGHEAKALRLAKRMSLTAFAEHLGISERTLSTWESRGSASTIRQGNQAILDTSLMTSPPDVHERFQVIVNTRASQDRLNAVSRDFAIDPGSAVSLMDGGSPDDSAPAGTAEPDDAQPTAGRVVREQISAIRCVLDAHDVPHDGPVREIPLLRDDVTALIRMRLQSRYGQLALRLPDLLPELHRALETAVGQRRALVSGLLVQAYRAADAVADKFGFYDLSARIIGLMMGAARESGDERAIAAAAYVRAETFFANGQYEVGRRMLERAAQRLMPEAGIGSAAAYGALHMRAAVLAARAGTLAKAKDHLLEAGGWAHGLPEGVYAGTVFGPASVRIHEVALAVDGGDPDAALTVAARWQPHADLPAERRSHFYIDLARAFAMVESPAQACDALWTARTIAPEHVHDHPQVREILGGLTRGRLGTDARVLHLWQWVGDGVDVSLPVPAAAGPGARSTS